MRKVLLKKWGISTYDNNAPFILESGLLEIQFTFPVKTGDYYLVSENNGKMKTLIGQDGVVSVSVSEGVFAATVKRYLDGRLREQFPLEPLEIRSVEGEVTAFPELSILQKSVKETCDAYTQAREALEKKETALDEVVNEAKNAMKDEAHRLAVAFFSFAYAEYLTDIQMNSKDLTPAEFVKVFGYDSSEFTEDELNNMSKEKDL